ncbi:hypothetical protein CEP54_012039 [Fusarium duplospermum]|uniref:Alginate lyase domain-containing protein n=1 Tax=Fusarium duplospermum TaxID=1325734 RepID=A0A428PB24_9HYPO|nr:hypothetical protein CEP54_012039 [Fusarium duplospermum]
MFLTKKLALLILAALFASRVYAAGESTTAIFSGTIATATSTLPASTGTIATATDRKVLFSLPSPLPKKKDLPQPPNVPRKKDIEYRFLALIALPAVIGLLVLAWTRFRLPTFSRCPCWQTMKISLLAVVGLVASGVSALHASPHLRHELVIRAVNRASSTFAHPGLLHSDADFRRIKKFVDSGDAPWSTGWEKLVARANPDYQPRPQEILVRGSTPELPENYVLLYRDLASAYALAIRWKITQDTAFADAAVRIIDAWAASLTDIWGSSDKFLASGLYGYQFANVAEILRTYPGWKGLEAASEMLLRVFYPMNRRFLIEHNGRPVEHYWANWDLCNIASMMSIGVLADNHTVWDEAIEYFKHGQGNGAIEIAIWSMHTEEGTGKKLGQNQEAGRDQGHATLDFALLGVIAQQAHNQGEDLFGYLENRILAGMEYVSKYNVGEDVPFTTYVNAVHGTHTEISSAGRGTVRPMAELFVAHYGSLKGRDVKWTTAYRDLVVEKSGGAEGGGGDYGTTSGGYDQLGFGTLLYRLKA